MESKIINLKKNAMIQPQELRIGDYVTDEFYENFKTIIEVDSITKKGINVFIEDDRNYPEIAQSWIEPEYTFGKYMIEFNKAEEKTFRNPLIFVKK